MAIVITAVAVLMYNHQAGELFGYPIESIGSVALLSTLLLFLTSRGSSKWKNTPVRYAKHFLVWLALGVVLILAYSFKDDARSLVDRFASELIPGTAIVAEDGSVTFKRASDGHFQVKASVNGATISMLVDSGASAVVLTAKDAKAIGLDTSALSYTTPVTTANGRAFTAPIILDRISVGGIEARTVRAMVAQEGSLRGSLLGMSYLDRLGSWSVSGDRITLTR